MPGPRPQTVALEAIGQSLGAVHEVEGLDILKSHGGETGEGAVKVLGELVTNGVELDGERGAGQRQSFLDE